MGVAICRRSAYSEHGIPLSIVVTAAKRNDCVVLDEKGFPRAKHIRESLFQ